MRMSLLSGLAMMCFAFGGMPAPGLAESLATGQAVLAERSLASFHEATIQSVDTGVATVAWKDGSAPSPVKAEKVLELPRPGEKLAVTAGALALCKWRDETQWRECRVTAAGDHGATVTYLSDGATGEAAWGRILVPTGPAAADLAAWVEAALPNAEKSTGVDAGGAPAEADALPILRNHDDEPYAYDLQCGIFEAEEHKVKAGSANELLDECILTVVGTQVTLKKGMVCEIRGGAMTCK